MPVAMALAVGGAEGLWERLMLQKDHPAGSMEEWVLPISPHGARCLSLSVCRSPVVDMLASRVPADSSVCLAILEHRMLVLMTHHIRRLAVRP